MKQPSSPDSEATIERRGRKPLPGPPRQSQSFPLTDYELLELQLCDPSGKKNRNAGMRALIAESMARRAATASAPNDGHPDTSVALLDA